MRLPNLNDPTLRPQEGTPPPERFDLQKHVHEQQPFFSGFWMFLSVCLTTAAVAASLVGGGYLLLGGKVGEWEGLLATPPDTASKSAEQSLKANNASTEEELRGLLKRYASLWEGSWSPDSAALVLAPDFSHATTSDAKGDVLPQEGQQSTKVKEVRLDSFVVLSGSRARADATFFTSREVSSTVWWQGERSPGEKTGNLRVHRALRYGVQFENTGSGWRIVSLEWLAKGPARICSSTDADIIEPYLPPVSSFSKQRPDIETVEAIVARAELEEREGTLGQSHVYYSDFELETTRGTKINLSKIGERRRRFASSVASYSKTHKVVGMAQRSPDSTVLVVSYSLEVQPLNSSSGNSYHTEWFTLLQLMREKSNGKWYFVNGNQLSTTALLDFYGL